jgi:hypothetical protein
MSDIVAKLRGASLSVKRPFRPDGEFSEFVVREAIELRRLDATGRTSTVVETIRPGMFVYGMIDELNTFTYQDCLYRRDCMPVFYVLEFLEDVTSQRAASSSAGIVSDNAEALVFACEIFRNIKKGGLKLRAINTSDLVMSHDPYYMPIDSIVTRMDAVVGVGEATPDFRGPRRVSMMAEANENFVFEKKGRIHLLDASDAILRSPFNDAAETFIIGAVPKNNDTATRKRQLPSAATPPRKAQALVDVLADVATTTMQHEEETVISSDNNNNNNNNDDVVVPASSSSSTTASSPLSFLRSVVPQQTQSSQTEPQAEPPAEPRAEPQAKPQAESRADPPAAPVTEPQPEPQREPQAEPQRAQAAPVTEPQLLSLGASQQRVDDICKPPLKMVNLDDKRWHRFKPQLTAFIRLRLESPPCDEEVLFQSDERVRDYFFAFAQERLAGRDDFEKFVAEVMHQHSDAAALFLSRFPDDLMHVAHFYVLLPIVYRKLCALALVDGVASMIDETIIAKARLIRQQKNNSNNSN